MLTILDRQYLKELLLNFVLTLAVITTIAVLAIATVVFHSLPEVTLVLFAMMVRILLVQALSFLLPLSLLMTVVFVYGRAAADHEITTLKASGIHPFRVLLPGLLLALVLAAIGLEVENRWAPWALYQKNVLPAQQATLKVLFEKSIDEGTHARPFGDMTIYWKTHEISKESGITLHGVLLEVEGKRKKGDTREPKRSLLSADRALLRFDEHRLSVVISFENAKGISGDYEDYRAEKLDIVKKIDFDLERARLKYQSGEELVSLRERARETVIEDGEARPLLRRYALGEVEGRIHERLARAATPILFLLLGAPLALVFRSGNRLVAFLLAIVIGMFVYYPIERLSHVLMSEQLVGPVFACWSGNLLLGAIGLGLLLFVVKR